MREHRVLSALIAAYLLLSAGELARVLLHGGPREYNAGFYQEESLSLPKGPRKFLWTRGDTGHVLRPLWGPVVRIPVYLAHPQLPAGGITVRLYADETLFDERQLDHNGWYRFDYYLPPILGADPWRQEPRRISADGVAELEPLPGDEPFSRSRWILRRKPDFIRVFTAWQAPPGPPSQWLRVESSETFVPAHYVDPASVTTPAQQRALDHRELGIGLGEVLWQQRLPAEGMGFYATERDAGDPFRWSRQRASWPLAGAPPGSSALLFRARVASPDAGEQPVTATFYWNAEAVESETFGDGDWHQIRLMALERANEPGVLSVAVSHTWNSLRDGMGTDDRNLGVAISEPRWQ